MVTPGGFPEPFPVNVCGATDTEGRGIEKARAVLGCSASSQNFLALFHHSCLSSLNCRAQRADAFVFPGSQNTVKPMHLL